MKSPITNAVVARMVRAFALIAFVIFMATAFRTGWTRLSTDFPNYYTAAVLARHREPLRNYYDWTWFARQMNYAGIENQLGAYTPQTPLTMLPIIGIAGFTPLTAKRVWLSVNLILLASVVLMLARMTKIRWEYIAALMFCGYLSLETNFTFGQYYVFLLFLFTLILNWLERDYNSASGFLSGVTCGLKLYTGPLLLYFVAKRKWGSVLGMLTAAVGLSALAIAMFGWRDIAYYLTHVFPRTMEGGSIDPYNPGVPTLSTLMRRLFVREPELNPTPLFDAPWLFFFCRTALQVGLIAFATLGVALKNDRDHRRDFVWFMIAVMLVATNAASYTFILLLAPVVLLLQNASRLRAAYLVVTYVLLNISLTPAWAFPKVWLLLLLFLVSGYEFWQSIRPLWAVGVAIAVFTLSFADAWHHMQSYTREPGHRYSQIAIENGALFSGYPAVTRYGIFFQGMADFRQGKSYYVLRRLHDGRIDTFDFPGNALHPVAEAGGDQIRFELVAHRRSTFMRLDPSTAAAEPVHDPVKMTTENATTVSPNGKWIAFTRQTAASEQIWIKDVASGRVEELAGGDCNNSSPVWELDSSGIIFASDCSRAFGLPALYRAPLVRKRF